MVYVVFDGILGVGKSELIKYMAQHFVDVRPVPERLSRSCLDMFNSGMAQQVRSGTIGEGLVIPGATRSQIAFLGLSLADALNIADTKSDQVFVGERCPRSHFEVFARTQHDLGHISSADFGALGRAFKALGGYVRQPDRYFGFDITEDGLRERLIERGRASDRSKMDPRNPYLGRLLTSYRGFFNDCPFENKTVIDTTGMTVEQVGKAIFNGSYGIFKKKDAGMRSLGSR